MNDPDSIRCWREADDGIHTRLYYNITSAEWNCTEHYGKCDSCPKSQSDPDIAGIGPRKCTVKTSSRTTMAYAWAGKTVAKIIGRKHAVRCAKICYDMVICLGDQQLVGSVALLLATIKKLHLDKTLSVYHFALVLGMVFLSSTAFTYAMICYRLRHQWDSEDDGCTRRLRHQQHDPHPWYRRLTEGLHWAIRIFFRLCLVALLLYNISVAARMKDLPWDCPAICFKDNPGYDWISMSAILPPLIMLPFAIQSSITDCIQLALAHNWWDPKAFLALMSKKIQSLLTWYRYQLPEHLRRLEEETKEEIQMGVGQTMAVILLVLPIIQLLISVSVHYGEIDKPTQNAGSDDSNTDINVDVDITDDTEEIINQSTGTPSAGRYPWGPF
ncbi:hypothetical protein B0H65DRAFT_500796 [Neurospora tetraspora]|uniref:Uncharacterized protein n=1 Tax=Neurospora tetraspora TaxID=94610 RepID=A0AAE0J9G6_9PEZI|nr:hypothetical protein B0H65DRAFT_500796 [Neurospora tetraspora]